MAQELIAWSAYDGSGAPKTGATWAFDAYKNKSGVDRTPPAVIELGGGLYGFVPGSSDVVEGIAFIVTSPTSNTFPKRQFGAIHEADDPFVAMLFEDASGALYAGVGTASFTAYKDRLTGNVLPQPTIVSLAPYLKIFTPSPSDLAAGVAFHVAAPASSYPLFYAGTVFLPPGSGDLSPPVFSNLTPAPGSQIGSNQTIGFDVTTATGIALRSLTVIMQFDQLGIKEVVYDDETGFSVNYTGTLSNIANGQRLSFVRVGGWPSTPRLTMRAVTINGVEAT